MLVSDLTLFLPLGSINCEYPLFELNARKIFGFRSSYDSFEIYYGTRESGELIFSAQGETTTDFKDYSFCSQLGFHTIVMKDGYASILPSIELLLEIAWETVGVMNCMKLLFTST